MNSEIKTFVINLINSESENTHLDFKKEQYPIGGKAHKKPEFLKDMLAFANLKTKRDKFIIIGVEESGGVKASLSPIIELNDQALYQQYLNQYIEPEINFEYMELNFEGNKLAFFRLFDNDKQPYLFKKDLIDKIYHFEKGSGFIRTGTSTRRLIRDDFEKMYLSRIPAVKDRSSDVSFHVRLVKFKDPEIRSIHYLHLQIDATNNSSRSIEFDVEVKISKSQDYKIIHKQELEKLIEKVKNDSRSDHYPYNSFSPNLYLNTYVECSELNDSYIFERIPEKFQTVAIKLKQNSETKDLFNGQIAIHIENTTNIELEIIARSDDFLKGPLVEKIKYPITVQ